MESYISTPFLPPVPEVYLHTYTSACGCFTADILYVAMYVLCSTSRPYVCRKNNCCFEISVHSQDVEK